ncbi:hypothetical protein RV12_GL001324 [Enterococcus quebecensis]|nr:hypothetical protein RV12_GL001324 [Enterococcus quebecensis]
MRGDFEVNRELTKLFIIAMFTFCSYSLGLFFNRIGVLFLIIFIFSAAIAYLKYIVVKSDSDEFGTIEEENILEVAGPFNTESEAINLFGEFSENWDGSEELLYLIERESNEEYFITIYVETVQKSEER